MTIQQAVGAVFRTFRLDAGLKLKNVAEKAGVSLAFVSEIERGVSQGSLETLSKLAGAFGVRLSDVFLAAEKLMIPEPDTASWERELEV